MNTSNNERELTIYDYLADEILEQELYIDTSSAANFELQLSTFAQKEYHFQRLYVQAVKAEREANLRVELTLATIVDEMYQQAEADGKPLPPSARAELRRTKAVLDPRYQRAKQEWINKAATSDILQGIVKAFRTKGFKLKELESLVKSQLYDKRLANGIWQDVEQQPTMKRVSNKKVRALLDDVGGNMEI